MSNSAFKPTICITDDDGVDRMIIKRALKSFKLSHSLAEADGLESALEVEISLKPDTFIIDINLGVVSGFEIARKILAARPKNTTPHIIFMSGVVMDHEQKLALELTQYPILKKPMNAVENAEFAAAVQRFFSLSELENIKTEICCVNLLDLIAFKTSNPVTAGILKSRKQTCGRKVFSLLVDCKRSNASLPELQNVILIGRSTFEKAICRSF